MSTIAQQVVNTLITRDDKRDQKFNDIYELSLRLSKMCKELGVDETQSQTGFHIPLSNLTLDVIKIEQYRDLLKDLEKKTGEIERELEKLSEKYEEGKNLKKQYPSRKIEISQDYERTKKNAIKYLNEAREMEKKLIEMGLDQSMDDQSMKKLEDEVDEQESELEQLMAELRELDDVEPNDAAIEKRLNEMREELQNFQILNDSNSQSNLFE